MRSSIVILFFSIIVCPNPLKIVCETVCHSDGDERGILLNGVCYCANQRDVKKFVFKLNRDIKGDVLIDEPVE